jgi:hypothetical protein
MSQRQAVDYLLNVKQEPSEDDNSKTSQESNNPEQTVQEQPEADTQETETDATEEVVEEEVESVDESEADMEDEVTDEVVQTEPETYTVKVNGEDVNVTLEELQQGYSRTSDYSRKTQQLAEQRKQFEQQATQIQAERTQLAENLKAVEQFLSNPVPQPDQNLINSDPSEYLRQKDAYEKHQDTVKAVKDEQVRLQQQQQQDLMQNYQKNLESAKFELLERIPSWKNADVATKEKSAVVTYAKRVGFSDLEMQTASDPRAIEVLRKAYLYDKLVAKNQVAKKKVTKAPKMIKGAVPTSNNESKQRKSKQLFDRLKKSGKREDAVNYLLAQKQQ